MGENMDKLYKVPMTWESSRNAKTGSWRSSRPIIDIDNCIKCYICWKFCPDMAIILVEGEYPRINYDYCKGCGICANQCPKKCIEMEREAKK